MACVPLHFPPPPRKIHFLLLAYSGRRVKSSVATPIGRSDVKDLLVLACVASKYHEGLVEAGLLAHRRDGHHMFLLSAAC